MGCGMPRENTEGELAGRWSLRLEELGLLKTVPPVGVTHRSHRILLDNPQNQFLEPINAQVVYIW